MKYIVVGRMLYHAWVFHSEPEVASVVSSKVFTGRRAAADTVRISPNSPLHVDASLCGPSLECQTHERRKLIFTSTPNGNLGI